MNQLIVICGAGASHGCSSVAGNGGPPLAKSLFSRSFSEFQARYPLVMDFAADLTVEEAGLLETLLRETRRSSPSVELRAQYWAVPLYLQDLLQDFSHRFSRPDNYSRLMNRILGIDQVLFVTLNYDTIIERALRQYQSFDNLHEYVTGPKLTLVKLHGSVNWGARVQEAGTPIAENPTVDDYRELCFGLASGEVNQGIEIEALERPTENADARTMRMRSDGFRYPALAVPLGSVDEIVCPPSQEEHLRDRLNQNHVGYGLHVLSIGYSALDTEPLKFIKESGNRIQTLMVVDRDRDTAEQVYGRISAYLQAAVAQHRLESDLVETFDGDFTKFSSSPELEGLVERVQQ